MPNPISQFISDRFIKPQVDAQVASYLSKNSAPLAYGLSTIPDPHANNAIGQPQDANYDVLYAIYGVNADVATCVRLVAGGVIAQGWTIGLMDPKGTPTSAQEKQINELTYWLKNPNPSKRFSLILLELATHLLISGNGYLNKVRTAKQPISELWGVHPATVRINADKFGDILGYIQWVHGQRTEFKPEEISHFRLSSPISDIYGRSPLESALEEIRGDLSALRANIAIFESGISPSMMVLLNDKATQTDAVNITERINNSHQGVSRWRKVLALSQTNSVQPYGNTLKDMEFSQLRELATTKIAAAFGVPKYYLGLKNAADYATSDALERQFYNTTIKPHQDILAEVFTEDIIHAFSPDLRFTFNEPDLRTPDMVSTALLTAHNAGIVNDNEVRAIVLNLPPRAGGDDYATTTDATPSDSTASTTADQAENTDEAGTAATNAPDKKTKRLHKSIDTTDYASLSSDREMHKDQLAAAFTPSIASFFSSQEQRYLTKLSSGGFKLGKRRVPRATDSTGPDANPNLDDYVQDTQADGLLDAAFVASLQPSLLAGAQAAQLQISITLRFDQVNPIVQRYLQTDALTHVQAINETTRNLLRATLTEGIGIGESVPQLSARVSQVFNTAQNYRSTLIARNETAQAYEYANRESALATGLTLEAVWLTAEDERVCPICGPLDGTTTPVGTSFEAGNPGEIHVSCRCTSIYQEVQ